MPYWCERAWRYGKLGGGFREDQEEDEEFGPIGFAVSNEHFTIVKYQSSWRCENKNAVGILHSRYLILLDGTVEQQTYITVGQASLIGTYGTHCMYVLLWIQGDGQWVESEESRRISNRIRREPTSFQPNPKKADKRVGRAPSANPDPERCIEKSFLLRNDKRNYSDLQNSHRGPMKN